MKYWFKQILNEVLFESKHLKGLRDKSNKGRSCTVRKDYEIVIIRHASNQCYDVNHIDHVRLTLQTIFKKIKI